MDRLALSEARNCLVAAVAAAAGDAAATGTLRLIPWLPQDDAMQEARPHCAHITGLAVDARGGLVFSCDASGVVIVSALLPRLKPDEAAVRSCRGP